MTTIQFTVAFYECAPYIFPQRARAAHEAGDQLSGERDRSACATSKCSLSRKGVIIISVGDEDEGLMKKGGSEIVGQAHDNNGKSVPLYRALRELLCSSCGREMREGTLFTRHQLPGQSILLSPRCSECAPFIVEEHKRSTMLDCLLMPEPTESEDKGASQKDSERWKKEVEHRLGPALARARQRSRSEE